MAGLDLGIIISFACGMLCMWALQNPRKAAHTIRSFLGRVGSNVEKVNEKYDNQPRNRRRPSERVERRRRDDDEYYEEPRRRRPKIEDCPVCLGEGYVKPKGIDFSGKAKRVCPKCDGQGQVIVND